jgi:chaperone BCS1
MLTYRNHPDRLDHALSRPGRLDVHMAFTSAEPSQARALFLHFYPLEEFEVDPISMSISSSSSIRITHQASSEKEISTDKRGPIITCQADIDALADKFTQAIFPEGEKGKVGGIQGATVSMASLQGYLLKYKEDPQDAAGLAAEWAKEMSHEVKRTLPKAVEGSKDQGKEIKSIGQDVSLVSHPIQ